MLEKIIWASSHHNTLVFNIVFKIIKVKFTKTLLVKHSFAIYVWLYYSHTFLLRWYLNNKKRHYLESSLLSIVMKCALWWMKATVFRSCYYLCLCLPFHLQAGWHICSITATLFLIAACQTDGLLSISSIGQQCFIASCHESLYIYLISSTQHKAAAWKACYHKPPLWDSVYLGYSKYHF